MKLNNTSHTDTLDEVYGELSEIMCLDAAATFTRAILPYPAEVPLVIMNDPIMRQRNIVDRAIWEAVIRMLKFLSQNRKAGSASGVSKSLSR